MDDHKFVVLLLLPISTVSALTTKCSAYAFHTHVDSLGILQIITVYLHLHSVEEPTEKHKNNSFSPCFSHCKIIIKNNDACLVTRLQKAVLPNKKSQNFTVVYMAVHDKQYVSGKLAIRDKYYYGDCCDGGPVVLVAQNSSV